MLQFDSIEDKASAALDRQFDVSYMLTGGVYILWRGDEILYVGQTECFLQRLGGHKVEGKMSFDEITIIQIADESERLATEFCLIKTLKPKFNVEPGKRSRQKLGLPPHIRTPIAEGRYLVDPDWDEEKI